MVKMLWAKIIGTIEDIGTNCTKVPQPMLYCLLLEYIYHMRRSITNGGKQSISILSDVSKYYIKNR
jgi:hypothetical protein